MPSSGFSGFPVNLPSSTHLRVGRLHSGRQLVTPRGWVLLAFSPQDSEYPSILHIRVPNSEMYVKVGKPALPSKNFKNQQLQLLTDVFAAPLEDPIHNVVFIRRCLTPLLLGKRQSAPDQSAHGTSNKQAEG